MERRGVLIHRLIDAEPVRRWVQGIDKLQTIDTNFGDFHDYTQGAKFDGQSRLTQLVSRFDFLNGPTRADVITRF